MLHASAKQIRDEFDTNRNVTAGEELDQLLSKAREAIEFMKVNIVQAKLNDRGNYGAFHSIRVRVWITSNRFFSFRELFTIALAVLGRRFSDS